MVDETTDFSNTVQLSYVLRYVTEMRIKEGFLKFENVTDKKRAQDLSGLVFDLLESYN